jgi:hypothetical protein
VWKRTGPIEKRDITEGSLLAAAALLLLIISETIGEENMPGYGAIELRLPSLLKTPPLLPSMTCNINSNE